MVAVSSWGRLGRWDHEVTVLCDRGRVGEDIQRDRPGLAHGMGRSYGDVCLNPGGVLWKTTGLDRFISFDAVTGRLVCEAGVLLRDIQRLVVPRGWMLPVTPGTELVTVGGAIANDVHGKNHHAVGSFGHHVEWMRLVRTDGDMLDCGPALRRDWFAATVGGMGLTGVITEAAIRLRPVPGPWLETETIAYGDLGEFMALSHESAASWEHSVSWFDCLDRKGGRGLFMRGNFTASGGRAAGHARRWIVPFVPPLSLVNRATLRSFNETYYRLNGRRAVKKTMHYESFFYPLDRLLEWNRLYGPRGFFQYQTVVPPQDSLDAVRALLRAVADEGTGSFLAVLKTFGAMESVGLMSFPQPGVTLALDVPNEGERTVRLFDRLDAIVREAKGRLYPAKDARMPRSLFEQGYPKLDSFLQYRDPGISSGLSRRLMGH
ncbi:MAG TPA: FAD-binding oxidoreductase [Nitrospira sp.]|nr:FAD-binding oxidoreductase [Nitrospira sp.]